MMFNIIQNDYRYSDESASPEDDRANHKRQSWTSSSAATSRNSSHRGDIRTTGASREVPVHRLSTMSSSSPSSHQFPPSTVDISMSKAPPPSAIMDNAIADKMRRIIEKVSIQYDGKQRRMSTIAK
jgi:hypothetical protein